MTRCPCSWRVIRPERMDEATIYVEARLGVVQGGQAQQASLLATYIKDVIGISARISIVETGSLARSTGKASRVRDLRQTI